MRIFNLAEELEKERKKNKELEKKIKHYEKTITFGDYVEELNALIDYKDRIDKAINYIEQYDSMTSIAKKPDEDGIFVFNGNFGVKEELLDILKGDNK